jgi:hypothetical protein
MSLLVRLGFVSYGQIVNGNEDSLRFMTNTKGLGAAYGRVQLCTSWNKVLICTSSLFYENVISSLDCNADTRPTLSFFERKTCPPRVSRNRLDHLPFFDSYWTYAPRKGAFTGIAFISVSYCKS